jgi:endonuclease G
MKRLVELTSLAVILFSLLGLEPEDPLLQYGTPDVNYRKVGEFLVSYDGLTRTPRWTLEYLTPKKIEAAKKVKRSNFVFKSDPEIPIEFRTTYEDFAGTKYDLGHLVPSANASTPEFEAATFTMLNVMPQRAAFNRGIWRKLEAHVRELASEPGTETWVVTLPIYSSFHGDTICIELLGTSRVWVPLACGKAVLHRTKDGNLLCRAWVIPQTANNFDLDSYRISTDGIEMLAGLNLWPKLPEKVACELELSK